MTKTFLASFEGEPVRGLRSEAVELAVMPGVGARVISLRDLRCGREWIWQPEKPVRHRALGCGAAFGDSGHTGIDECLPTIAPCAWRGRALPDHGEVWSVPWTLDEAAFARGEIATTLRLPRSPFVFARTVSVVGETVHWHYTLENTSAVAEEFVWAWHPLLGIRPGDRLELPAGVESMRLEIALGAPVGALGETWQIPRAYPDFDVGQLTLGANNGECVKGFLGPLPLGEARTALHGAAGERFELGWSTRENPLMGLWLSRGFAGWYHVALEPTNGAPDRLDLAVREWRRHGVLGPGERRHWSLRLLLTSP